MLGKIAFKKVLDFHHFLTMKNVGIFLYPDFFWDVSSCGKLMQWLVEDIVALEMKNVGK